MKWECAFAGEARHDYTAMIVADGDVVAGRRNSDNVMDIDITPLVRQVLGNEAAMAMMGLVLAAKQAAPVEKVSGKGFLYLPLAHEVQKPGLVLGPNTLVLLVGVQHFFRRRQFRDVSIVDPVDGTEEVREIIPLGEAGELRDVIQTNVEDTDDSSGLQLCKELLGGLFREPDRMKLELVSHVPPPRRNTRFDNYPGIIVLRLHDQSRPSVVAVVTRLMPLLATESLVGCLWIVDEVGMRIRRGGTP